MPRADPPTAHERNDGSRVAQSTVSPSPPAERGPGTAVSPWRGEVPFVAHMAVLSGAHPRNSLAAIRECFDAGVERIEIDAHSLAGPDFAIFHDRRLEDHTTGTGTIGRATPDDIRALRFLDRPDERPLLLSEVVAMACERRTEMQLDLKDWRPLADERLRALIDTVAPVKERVIVSSGQDWNLRRLHRADPELAIGFDPGHYIDHAVEASPVFLPRTIGAYDYRDDHPLAYGRTEETADYLRHRSEMLVLQAPASREFFLNYRLVLQMLDDGFNVADFLHERAIDANVWTLDYHGLASLPILRRLIDSGIDRVTTNTMPAWRDALARG
jgi:glycerophosphoryl diester phosphodiesterase